ncbi:MAG: hypothetical protein WAN65_18950 [Candidatus Sulfotelmatobacter sp.]
MGTLQFFVLNKIAKTADDSSLVPFLGYTLGGVLGTVTDTYLSLLVLGK